MKTASKKSAKKSAGRKKLGPDHECFWREAAMKLAKCVVFTIQSGGKPGVGSGMVMRVDGDKKTIERWDKDFIEALAFIGVEMVDKPKAPKRRAKALAA